MEAVIDKVKPPYMHDYYNIKFLFHSPLSQLRSTEARVYNALIEGLNEKVRLPKYILVMLDKDAIEGVMYRIYDCGFKMVFRESIVPAYLAQSVCVRLYVTVTGLHS